MRKRKYLLATIVCLGIAAAAGCGDKKSEKTADADKDTQLEDTVESEGEEEEEQTDAEEKKEEKDILNFKTEDYVKLGEYKGLSVKYPVPTVSDEDVELYIQGVLDEETTYEEQADRAVQDGDAANIDFTAKMDGKEYEEGSGEGYEFILGTEEFSEDFEKNLIGKKAGETAEFSVTLPEDYYDEEIAGKEVEYSVTINSVSEVIVPEYNDEFVAKVTEYKNMEEYEDSIREELIISGQESAAMEAGENALTLAVMNSEVNEYPQDLYDFFYEDIKAGYEMWAQMSGMDNDEFIESIGGEKTLGEEALKQVNEFLVVKAIAEKEGLDITDENYKESAEGMVEQYEYDSLEEFEKDFGKNYITTQIIRERVVNFLYESAELEEVSQEEYYKEQEGISDDVDEKTEDESSDDVDEKAEDESSDEEN